MTEEHPAGPVDPKEQAEILEKAQQMLERKEVVDPARIQQPARPPLRLTVHVGRALATLHQLGKPYALKDEKTGEQRTVGTVKWAREKDGDVMVEVDPQHEEWVYQVLEANGRIQKS